MLYGWDVSTSIVGYAALDDDGRLVECSHLDLRKVDGLDAKGDALAGFVAVRASRHGRGGTHFVEERLGGFSRGGTMQQTLLKLAAFNAIASYVIHVGFEADVRHVHTATVKSVLAREFGLIVPAGTAKDDKKRATWDFVCDREPTFPKALNKNGNPAVGQFDVADAYVVALVGRAKLNG